MNTNLIPQDDTPIHQIALAIARNKLGMQLPAMALAASLGVEPSLLLELLHNKEFVKVVRKYKRELEEDNEGIRLKSAIALEDCIPALHKLVHDADTPPNVVVQGFKALAETAHANKQEDKKVSGPGFTINIDLSGLKDAGVISGDG